MKTKVFLSHSSKDKQVAGEVCQFLEAHGVNCWIAPRNVTPGKNYGAAIVDAIDECGVFVLILSGESNQSGQVVREVERAAAANAVIIPFRIEDIQPSRDLEFYVSSSHWLDAVGPSRDKHLNELLAAITSWHGPGKGSATTTTSPSSPTAIAAAPRLPRKTMPMIPLLIAGAVVILLAAIYFLVRGSKPTVTANAAVAAASPLPTASNRPSSIATAAPSAKPDGAPTTTPAASILPPVIKQITASSELVPQMFQGQLRHYEANLAFDNDITTAWVAAKSGPGEWIEVRFQQPSTLTSISIYGGYGVDRPRFHTNNRVNELRLTFSNGFNRMLRLEDKPRFQRFDLPAHPTLNWIRFEIVSIYPGSKYDATPISEIKFNEPE